MTQVKSPHLLETAPIGKLLLQYSIPAIIAMTVISVYNIIDSIFIGHGVGPLAISGLALTFPLMNLVVAFSTLVGVGGAAMSSIYMGRKDDRSATEVLHHVLIYCIVSGICFGALTYTFLDEILYFFGASEATLPYAHDFMKVLLSGNVISFLFMGLNNVLRATGYPKKAMLSALLSVGVNVILAPIFIYHFEWGMKGAALATILAQSCGLIWVFIHFFNKSSFVHFQRGYYHLRWSITKSIFSVGMSPFLMNACSALVVVVVNQNFKLYGGDLAIGAYGIVNRICTMFFMVVLGLTQGMQPIVGFNYGARHYDRVRRTLRRVIGVAVSIMTCGWLISEIFPSTIVEMFSDDITLNVLSRDGLRIAIFCFPLVGAQTVITNFFQSIGKAHIAIALSLSRQLLFLIPLLFILPRLFGLDLYGLWLSMPSSDLMAFLAAAITLKWYFRKSDKWLLE